MSEGNKTKNKIDPSEIEVKFNSQSSGEESVIENASLVNVDRNFYCSSVLPQFLATGAKNLLLLTYGMTLGVSTIAIPAMNRNNADPNETNELWYDKLQLTEDEISWFSSIQLICVPLGCSISGLLTQPYGRKRSMMALNLPFLVVWILLYSASHVKVLYLAMIISGLAGGIHEAPVLTYVAEITEPRLRGMLGSTSSTTVILGTVSQLFLGTFYHWRTVALINTLFPVLAFTALYFIPESPHWLIQKGRIEDAKKSLCWLRGWVQPEMIEKELNYILRHNEIQIETRKDSRFGMKSYLRRSFLLPYFIITMTFFAGHFGGMSSIHTNAARIFALFGILNEKNSPNLMILGIAEFAGSITCVGLVHLTGKRRLLICTTLGCAICLSGLSLYAYCLPGIVHASWIPMLLLNANGFFVHCGIRLLPWVLVGELYPTDIRGTASGASAFWYYIFAFGANKSFFWMHHHLQMFGLMALYAITILFGSLFLYFFLPETEGCTLQEIQAHFRDKANTFDTVIKKDRKICKEKQSLNSTA